MTDLSKYRDPRFSLPAVRVKSDHPDHEQGYFVINESDFDPEKHELWEEPVAETIVVEDGTGLPNANSHVSESTLNTYGSETKDEDKRAKPVARAEKLHLPLHERK